MRLAQDVRPITYLKSKTAELVGDLTERGRSAVITQHRMAKVVEMDVQTYDRWRKELALLRIVAHSEADIKAGRTVSHREAMARARRAIQRARRDK